MRENCRCGWRSPAGQSLSWFLAKAEFIPIGGLLVQAVIRGCLKLVPKVSHGPPLAFRELPQIVAGWSVSESPGGLVKSFSCGEMVVVQLHSIARHLELT
jgi:hypothetical protein